MRTIIWFASALLLSVTSLFGQDIILFRDGNSVEAVVVEITQTEIKYKKFKNPNGPLYTKSQSDVQSIKYAYGEVEEFTKTNNIVPVAETAQSDDATDAPQLISLSGDTENNQIIKRFSEGKMVPYKVKSESYKVVSGVQRWELTENSVISNEQVKVSFESSDQSNHRSYNLVLSNKTNQTIYIDLGNSFSIDKNGARCYFDPTKTTTISNNSGSGAALNLGGVARVLGIGGNVGALASAVTVGKQNQTGTTTTYTQNRFSVVPPKSTGYISKWVYDGEHNVERGELFSTGPRVNYNGVRQYNINNTPFKREYIITYSTDPDFKTYSQLKFTIYVSQAIGMSKKDISIPHGAFVTH